MPKPDKPAPTLVDSKSAKNSKPTETENSFEGLTFEVVEDEETNGERTRGRGVYLFPNLITTLALLSGFCSIILSTHGHFAKAAMAIYFSAVLDGLDGRVARMLHAQSAFGEQFDSLADMLSFGIAPAMLMYHFALQPLNRIGVACAFVFTACAAFRLARFNVQIGTVDKKYFIGLASPLAAILVTTAVVVAVDKSTWFNVSLLHTQMLAAVWVVTAGLLMVSNLRYFSFKEFDRKRVPFVVLVGIVLVLGLIIYDIPLGILTISVLYALSGIVTSWHKA